MRDQVHALVAWTHEDEPLAKRAMGDFYLDAAFRFDSVMDHICLRLDIMRAVDAGSVLLKVLGRERRERVAGATSTSPRAWLKRQLDGLGGAR